VGARLVDRALAARLTTPTVAALAPVALAVLCWALADALGGNGFIAAFVGGLCAAPLRRPRNESVLEFAEETGTLLSLAVFFIFGTVALELMEHADAAIVAYGVLSLTAIRMVPVALALAGTRLHPSTVAFMGWFGPRGLASIVLALTVAEQEPGLPGLDRIIAAMTVTVLMSIVAHGLTAPVLSRAYGAAIRDLPADAPEHGVADGLAAA
jgi:NhaP-type Na+/H+ or K+/H+ antiporter